jgi:hypothetical protein
MGAGEDASSALSTTRRLKILDALHLPQFTGFLHRPGTSTHERIFEDDVALDHGSMGLP